MLLFIIFGAVCIGAAINLLVQKHPINSALSLIVVMGSLALLYLLLGAEFVAAVQVIVYAGAVMVLFVFVIMLLNAGEEERTPHGSRVAMMLGVPGLIVGLGIGIWVVIHYAGLDRIAIGGPDHTQRHRGLRQSARGRAVAVPRLPAAVRSHVGLDPHRHHGRRGTGAEGGIDGPSVLLPGA